MKFSVITVFPEMITQAVGFGVLAQGLESGLLHVEAHSPRKFSQDKHKSIDDRPFGGGDGMLMLSETLVQSIESVRTPDSYVIYLSPQGRKLDQEKVKELAKLKDIILVCGRYGGIDQRVINQCIDEEVSIGDFVLSGGEIGALAIIDAVARWIPGVLGHVDSAQSDSFTDGLLEAPQFTRPRDFEGMCTPEVLLSGNHELIKQWKFMVSLIVTFQKRPELFWRHVELWRPSKKKDRPLVDQVKAFYASLSEADLIALDLQGIDPEFERVL